MLPVLVTTNYTFSMCIKIHPNPSAVHVDTHSSYPKAINNNSSHEKKRSKPIVIFSFAVVFMWEIFGIFISIDRPPARNRLFSNYFLLIQTKLTIQHEFRNIVFAGLQTVDIHFDLIVVVHVQSIHNVTNDSTKILRFKFQM